MVIECVPKEESEIAQLHRHKHGKVAVPKKKKKHVQLIKESFDIQGATDVDIKRWIKIWNKEDNQN